MPMNKASAIELFGSVTDLAVALGITRQAIYQWPDELAQDQQDRIVGAAIRTDRMRVEQSEARKLHGSGRGHEAA